MESRHPAWHHTAQHISLVILALSAILGMYAFTAIDRGLPLPSWSPVGELRQQAPEPVGRPVVGSSSVDA